MAKGALRRNKLHIPHPAASGRSRPFRCSSFSHANRFAGFAREPLLWNPLKTTKKGVATPFLDHSQEFGLCKACFTSTKRDADAYQADRRDSRNTLRLFRFPYVKYSTGANLTIRIMYRALRKPDSTVARRAFLDRRCYDNTHNVAKCFSARQRYFASPAPLFCILFSGKTEKSMPPEAQLQRCCKNGTSGESGKEFRALRARKFPAHSVRG